jgi:hypothetical protein
MRSYCTNIKEFIKWEILNTIDFFGLIAIIITNVAFIIFKMKKQEKFRIICGFVLGAMIIGYNVFLIVKAH